jgi:excisionase family DNA binding protein
VKGGDYMPDYFTCGEVASMYKVKTITVWDWIRRKKLPALKIGRDYRIRPEDIKAFEKGRETINT